MNYETMSLDELERHHNEILLQIKEYKKRGLDVPKHLFEDILRTNLSIKERKILILKKQCGE